MKNLSYVLTALLIAFSTAVHAAVDVRARHITSQDGIPNNTVRKIFQDSRGFIWLATIDGLCRYDGYSFVTLRPSQTGKISVPDHRIYEIKEDCNGLLWIATEPEIFGCFDSEKGQFVDYTGCGEYLQHYKHYKEDSRGNVWLTHLGNGIRRVTYSKGKFTSQSFKTELGNAGSDMANCLYEDKARGCMWVGYLGGVGFIRDGGDKVEMIDASLRIFGITSSDGRTFFLSTTGTVFTLDDGDRLVPAAELNGGRETLVYGAVKYKDTWYIFTTEGGFEFDLKSLSLRQSVRINVPRGIVRKDNRGNWWVFNQTGKMWYMDIESGEVLDFDLIPEDRVKFVDDERYRTVKDGNGILWIATYGNGLFAYTMATGELQHFEADAEGTSLISTNFLQNVFEDRAGGIWVSSEYTGLTFIEVLNRGAERIVPEPGSQSDRSNMIRMITYMPDGGILVGNRQGGVYAYDASLSSRLSKRQYPANVYCVAAGPDGSRWVGTRGNGLCIDGKWYTPDSSDPMSISNVHIFSICRDSSDRMWLGTFGGGLNLAVKRAEGGYGFMKFLSDSYSQSQVRCIAEDAGGWIWAGTSAGLYIFRPDSLLADPKGGYVHYDYAGGALHNDAVKSILRDSKGRMWIGTSGGGLSVCTPGGDYSRLTFRHYGMSDGLVSRMVQSVVEDRQGCLWIATEYGVSRFDPDRETFENFFFSNYSLGNYYSDNAGCLAADGKVLFGSGHGVVAITPELASPVDSQLLPVASLTNLLVNGVMVYPGDDDSPLVRSLLYSDALRLKHNQNSFTVEFSSFEYDKTQAVKYTYKLDKYDKSWSVPSAINFATYKNLKPGSYTLRVKACSASGVWSDRETVLRLTITPPYWRTPWAYLIYIILLFAALYVSWRIIRNFATLRQRIAVERQLTEYKLEFFTNISHEFRTPLTLIEGALEKIHLTGREVRSFASSLKVMDKSTKRMLRLVNQLLEFRRMQTGKLTLQLEEADVVSFIYEIYLSFADTSESKSMDYRFHSDKPVYKMYIDKGILDKVVYNIVSNAFKYTPCGGRVTLDVKVDEEAGTLMIRVSDTGVGIPKEKQAELFSRFMQSSFSSSSMGVGLNLSHELVAVHHGSIAFAENEGGGSVFTVLLPLDKGVYSEADFLIPDNVLLREEESRRQAALSEAAGAGAEAGVLPEGKTDKKILIIEDDSDMREFLREGLSEYFDVEAAADGESGLAKAKEMDFDLVICDVLMAGMNGFEVTEKLKGDFDTSHIPVILLTALASEESRLHGVESGADAYITKPFGTRLLLTTVFKLIEQREKLRKKFSTTPAARDEALPIVVTDRDKRFADRLFDTLERHYGDPKFNVDDFAVEMGMGRTAFYKKVRGITGYTPNEYIRVLRLKKAASLLLEENLNISEVAYKVGICDPFYFSKCFKQQFGVSPSVYVKSGGNITQVSD